MSRRSTKRSRNVLVRQSSPSSSSNRSRKSPPNWSSPRRSPRSMKRPALNSTSRRRSRRCFPSLARPAGTNWFHKAFRLPKKMKSRMQELFEPLRDLYEMLGRSQSLFSFMGNKTLPYDVTGRRCGERAQASGSGQQRARSDEDPVAGQGHQGRPVTETRERRGSPALPGSAGYSTFWIARNGAIATTSVWSRPR